MRKSLLILILLSALISTSATAIAGDENTNVDPIADLKFTDKVVYFLDHTSSPEEGNWITLGCPEKNRSIQLPQPIKLTYNGPKNKEYGGVSGTLNKEEKESYTITYPSTSSYTTHPVYLPDENVTLSFYGEAGLKGKADIYLFRITSDCAYGLLDAFNAGEIRNLNNLFEKNVKEEYEKYSANIGNNGDILNYDLGRPGAGQYCAVIVQQNEDKSMTVLSSTAFVVAEYELSVISQSNIEKGEDLDMSMTLKGASGEDKCTYGAVLIKEQAYKANIEINSDGTKDGTSVIVNEVDIIDKFDIDSSNYRSKLNRNELQTEIPALIGGGNGAIAIGNTGDNKLSITAFDLPVGSYYLLVGAYSPEKGLIGLAQEKVEIQPKGNSGGGGHKSGSGGAGGSPEPAKNVKTKELCQQFVSNGNRIKFEFTKEATSVGYIEFDARKTAGKITTIVEELKGKSSLTPAEPKGSVYQYLNIWVGNGGFSNSKNIENAVVGFKVSKEWINENHINEETITLQHFNGSQWESLNTEKVDENNKYIYFEAETLSFSPFAITASKSIIEIGEKEKVSEEQPVQSGQQENSELDVETEMPSKKNGSSPAKIASFFIGFLIIILMGTAIKKRAEMNNEDTDSEDTGSEGMSSEGMSSEK